MSLSATALIGSPKPLSASADDNATTEATRERGGKRSPRNSYTRVMTLSQDPVIEAAVPPEPTPTRHPIWRTLGERIFAEVSVIVHFALFVVFLYIAFMCIFERHLFDPLNVSYVSSHPPLTFDTGSAIFSILTILILGLALGRPCDWISLPTLLGMLVAGVFLRNCHSPYAEAMVVPAKWSMVLRKMAFVVILLRAGISLDYDAINKAKGLCARLAFLPCIIESVVLMLAGKVAFDMDWGMGLLLGFAVTSASPAIIVPAMIEIGEQGLGADFAITNIVTAAVSVDNICAITLFSVVLSFTFSTKSFTSTLIQVPLVLLMGALLGAILGYGLRLVRPSWRFTLFFTTTIAAYFASISMKADATGAITCLLAAFIAGQAWKKEASEEGGAGPIPEERVLRELWILIFQPLLFGLIGYELTFTFLTVHRILLGSAIILVGVAVRIAVGYACCISTTLPSKERIFVALSTFSKGTVQAALAPVALDMFNATPSLPPTYREAAITILALSVLSIILTAPIGASVIRFTAPFLLRSRTQ